MGDYEVAFHEGHRVPRYYLSCKDLIEDGTVTCDTADEARAKARKLLARRFEQTPLIAEQCESWSCVIQDEQRNFVERILLASLVDGIGDEIVTTRSFYPQ